MTEIKFFVYGSMSEGLVHFNKIRDFVVDKKSGTISGNAYRLNAGFPVVLKEGEDTIPGDLVTLRAPTLLFNLLDEFHGFSQLDPSVSLYFKEETEVKLTDGSLEKAFVYFLNPIKKPSNATPILGGDWKASLAAEPPLVDKMTERQKTYIVKLGAITGREIVPIDLPLYRELMNLEMIVDKGRRLALSKTGHEVLRYLN